MAIPSTISSLLVTALVVTGAQASLAQQKKSQSTSSPTRAPAAEPAPSEAELSARSTGSKPMTNVTFLVGLWSWREKFKIKSDVDESEKRALLVGTSVGLQYQSVGQRSAWSTEVALVSGRANSNSSNTTDTIYYESNRVPWSAVIFTPSYFLRPSPRVMIGLGAPLLMGNLKWTTEDETLTFETLPAFSAGLLFQTEIMASKTVLLQQSIGLHAASKSLMYNFGLGYIIP